MEKQTTKSSQKGKSLIIVGFIGIGVLFLIYSRFQTPEITPEAISAIERLGIGFYVALVAVFATIAYGLYHFHKQKVIDNGGGLFSIIALVTWNNKSRKIFLAVFVGYGIFFSLTAGTLVYQPEVTFSYHYGAKIPSVQLAPCCGDPGYMPLILVYLTEHVGLQIIPINLVLQIVVSYLVGLNAAVAVSAFSISKKSRGISTVGATTGLFIACPTCVGSFMSIFVGTASGIAFTIAVTQMQTIFIALSIPILLLTPFVLARKLRNPDGSCAVDTN